ncbi:YheC/YheD family protein [Heliophilum fasciatum]|uniref:YheC/D-like protein n=1 Tax=Heliophilum fasciatum TaxID=35700 RepID=A0A4R2REZ5_9FIRM|nr:YheC/YheD family protein [Heliophilum fasciatum]MCW2279199.1 hypothetical protein [Heliophilum fasciatum]TCP60988.1 YheC/D-like protein [Heliophilum fasciatum]
MLVGIMIHPRLQPGRWGESAPFFQQLAEEGTDLGIRVVFFSPGMINWRKQQMQGYRWESQSEQWRVVTTGLPHVVYDRFFAYPGMPVAIHACYQGLRKRRIPVFNPPLGNKYSNHCKLMRDPVIAPHLPATQRWQPLKRWWQPLKRWNQVYIKPVNGTKGKGILRLTLRKKRAVLVESAAPPMYRKMSWSQMKMQMPKLLRGRTYIVQQGLQTARWDDKIFDIRVLWQRDRQGEWLVTGAAVRVGANGITCNLHAGATALPLDVVLEDAQIAITTEEIHRLGKQIIMRLNRSTPLLGEVGLDFLIDQNQHLWFIEANSRPGRAIFNSMGDGEGRRCAVRRPLEYACYLAERRKVR